MYPLFYHNVCRGKGHSSLLTQRCILEELGTFFLTNACNKRLFLLDLNFAVFGKAFVYFMYFKPG